MPRSKLLGILAASLLLFAPVGCSRILPNASSTDRPTVSADHAMPPGLPSIVGQAAERYVLMLKQAKIPATMAQVIAQAGGRLEGALDGYGVVIASSSHPEFARRLGELKIIEGVSPTPMRQLLSSEAMPQAIDPNVALTPDGPNPTGPSGEPLSGYQWGLTTTNAAAAWDRGYSGQGVRVAVLDSGIDPDNLDLAPNLDLTRSLSFIPTEPSIVDFNGHGSHVAGLIAAANNDYGVTGVAFGASYFAVKVLDATGFGDDAGVLLGIAYAADQGAKIINLSVQSPTQDKALLKAFAQAIRYANQRGALVVAAAGNLAGSPKSLDAYLPPAQANGCIAVSSVGPQAQQNFDTFSLFSNFGHFVEVAAPGGNIGIDLTDFSPVILDKRDLVLSTYSTHVLPHVDMGVNLGPAPHLYLAGTSQAAPHVSGAAALLLQAEPHLSPTQVKQRLMSTCDELGKPGRDEQFGKGRINIGSALR